MSILKKFKDCLRKLEEWFSLTTLPSMGFKGQAWRKLLMEEFKHNLLLEEANIIQMIHHSRVNKTIEESVHLALILMMKSIRKF